MINGIVKGKLCNSCGTCISACPFGAIYFEVGKNNFEIKVDKNKCKNCGLCLKVCPGQEVNFEDLNKEIFGKGEKLSYSPYLGYYKNCYLGHSLNQKIRFHCSSGGMVTSFLIYLLRQKIIDGALVTGMEKKNPLISKPFLAFSEKEIFEARGSKYTPVVLNQCLKEIIKSKKEKFAVVGLPCHIEGIRKFQKINPVLKRKIKICLGLICGQEVNFFGTKLILKLMKIKPEEVKKISYRGNGWPGEVSVMSRNGEIKKISFPDIFKIFSLGFFTPERCFLCSDFTNELADISFGDAWIPRLIGKGEGFNFIISRTKEGEELLKKIKKEVFLEKIEKEKILKAYSLRFLAKKDSFKTLKKTARFLNLETPNYVKEPKSKLKLSSFLFIIFYLNSYFSNNFPDFFLKIPLIFWRFLIYFSKKTLNFYKK